MDEVPPNIYLEFHCDSVLGNAYKLVDPSSGITQEFNDLEKGFEVARNLANDLGVKVDCPSYVLVALACERLIPFSQALDLLEQAPIEENVVNSWGGRLRFMNGTAGPSGETNG